MNPRLYIQLLMNAVRFSLKRLIYRKRFTASLVQRFSLLATIELHEQGRVRLGRNLCVGQWCSFQVTGKGLLDIGDKVFFNRGCMISCQQRVTIGNGCIFGPDIKIYDNDHRFTPDGLDLTAHRTGEITIGEGTWVGANVVILRDTKIGKNCVVGAGSVVKGSIPDNSMVVPERNLTITPIESKAG